MKNRTITSRAVAAAIAGGVFLVTGSHAGAVTPCEGAGTVFSEARIGQFFGGFGAGLDAGDRFGDSVVSIGDLDGDGVVDVAVGAIFDDDGGVNRGAVWILFLNADGTVKGKQKISSTEGGFGAGLDNSDFFGVSIASLGDLDGDGVTDIAVGATGDDDGGTDRGAVWILLLNPDGTVKGKQKISSTQGGFGAGLDDSDAFGFAVANIGDLDGDDVNDIAVGAFGDDDGGTDRGAVWVLFLNPDGTVKGKQKISSTEGGFGAGLDNSDLFGVSVANLGDLDGDGVSDIAVGAEGDDDGGTDRGAVWVLFLNSDGTVKGKQKISSTQGGFGTGLDNSDLFGIGIACLGDLDGDGVADIAVGAYRDDDAGTDRGAVWVLFLNPDSTVKAKQKISQTDGSLEGPLLIGGSFGRSVALIGSVDGRPLVGVGASAGQSGANAGEIWLLALNTCTQAPTITTQPASILLGTTGGLVQLQTAATGSGTLDYQWFKNNTPLSDGGPFLGTNTPTLTVFATAAQIGTYTCIVSNEFGEASTAPAILALTPSCLGDINADGIIDALDLGILLNLFGQACLP